MCNYSLLSQFSVPRMFIVSRLKTWYWITNYGENYFTHSQHPVGASTLPTGEAP